MDLPLNRNLAPMEQEVQLSLALDILFFLYTWILFPRKGALKFLHNFGSCQSENTDL